MEQAALPTIFDIVGMAVFAISGAVAAARERQTFVTVGFFALITGVGGGSLRDVLIGAPVFWVGNAWAVPVCLVAALLVWFTPERWWNLRLLEWADALGLAAFATFGTIKALSYGLPPGTAIVMGIVTGCAGGILRDVLAHQPSILMRPELYVTAAALSSALAAGCIALGMTAMAAGIAGTAAGFVLRGAAIRWSIALPAYGRKRD
jgi:uncharacterized membrane protein YeiH